MSEREEIAEETLEQTDQGQVETVRQSDSQEDVVASVQEKKEEDLAAQLAKAQEKARDIQDKMLRMAAEFENFKKRSQREREAYLKYAEEDILKELLPSVDNLERAIEQGRNTDDVAVLLEGVEMTFKGIVTALEKFGLKSLDGVGESFDPNFHEAMAMEASSEVPENNILQEFQKGYMYKDRLLRAAKVVVSKGNVQE